MRSGRRRRIDYKLLVLVGIGGLVLIAAPLLVFVQLGDSPSSGVVANAPAIPSSSDSPAQDSSLPAAAAQLDQGRLMILARGQSNGIMRNYQSEPAGRLSGWTPLGGKTAGCPIVAKDASGRLPAFIIGTDGALWEKPETASNADVSAQWRNLDGNNLVGTPAAAQDADGKLVVVARDADGSLWKTYQSTPGGDDWSGWEELPASAHQDPAIYRDSQGKLRIFAVGHDGQMRTITQTRRGTDAWSEATQLGGRFTSPPAVTMDEDGQLQIFALDARGSLWQKAEVEGASNSWRDWQDLGGHMRGRPIAVADAHDTVVVFALDKEGSLWHVYQGVTTPWVWGPLEGSLAELSAVAEDSEGQLVVYGIGKKGGMEERHQEKPASGPWSEWANKGGVFPRN